MEQENATLGYLLIIGGIIFGAIIIYFEATKKSRKESKRINQLNDDLSKYRNYGEEKLYALSFSDLKNIAKQFADLRGESVKYLHTSSLTNASILEAGMLNVSANVGSILEEGNKFTEYQTGIKRLDLELKSESITNESYKEQFEALQKRLFKSVWDITSTSPSTAKKTT